MYHLTNNPTDFQMGLGWIDAKRQLLYFQLNNICENGFSSMLIVISKIFNFIKSFTKKHQPSLLKIGKIKQIEKSLLQKL